MPSQLVSKPSSNKKRKTRRNQSCSKRTFSLLSALASTTSSVVGKRASGTDGLVALADVAANVVVTATDLTVDGSLVLGAADALEVGSFGLLAGGRVDVAALGQGDLAVVAGALAADLHFGAGELVLDGLVDAGLEGWKEEVVRIWSLENCSRLQLTGVRGTGGATGGVIDAVGLLSALGVEVGLSLLGDGDGVLTLVCGRHYDRCGGGVVVEKGCWCFVLDS